MAIGWHKTVYTDNPNRGIFRCLYFYERENNKMYTLSDKKIDNIYKKLLQVANLYNQMIGYDFLIIVENYDSIIMKFRKEDFLHLTGLKLTVSDRSFYNMFTSNTFIKTNIKKQQKYTYRVINKKLDNLINMINCFTSVNHKLLIKRIHTHTRDYPYGIVGDNFILCLDGENKYHPKSIRNDKINTDYDDVVNIIAIFRKRDADKTFNDNIYNML